MTTDFEPVAVVGYDCLFPPDGYDAESYWRNLLAGTNGISTPPPERWDWQTYYSQDREVDEKTYCKFGGFLDDYRFPNAAHGIDDGNVRDLNRTQLMVLDTVLRTMGAAGYTPEDFGSTDTALFVGNMLGDEQLVDVSLASRAPEIFNYISGDETFQALPPDQRSTIENEFFDTLRTRFGDPDQVSANNAFQVELAKTVSRILGLSGPSLVADAACASALAVVDIAARYLQDRTHSAVFACGVLGNMSVTGNVSFAKIGGLSDSHSAPLDAGANGLIPGEGAGTVLLKRLDDALAQGDRIAGVIRGVATRCDGKGKAVYAPSPTGQVAAMRQALKLADVRPEQLDHVETHATGTPMGDPTEIMSLKELFSDRPTPRGNVTLGSVKSQIGHTFSAAGMANLAKILLAFEHEKLPPTHNFHTPNPRMELENSPFRVATTAESWARSEGPWTALCNAFGFGGVNSSLCLEQYNPRYHRRRPVHRRARRRAQPLAVVGVGGVTPYAREFSGIAANRSGEGALSGFPADRWLSSTASVWDPGGRWRGGVIENLKFPWQRYRVPPSVVAELDRSQLLAIMAAGRAFDDSGVGLRQRRDTGVFIGATCGMEAGLSRNLRIRLVEYASALTNVPAFEALDDATRRRIVAAYETPVMNRISPTRENALPGYMDNITAGRLCNLFDVRGPAFVVDDDVCSFGGAVDIAARYLEQGECSMALVGGVHANLSPEFTHLFARRVAEATHHADTLIPAEAAVFFVLKPLSEVEGEERVHAVISDAARATTATAGVDTNAPFYFGAQGALGMLDAVAELGESANGETQVDIPQLGTKSLGYRIRLTTRPEEPRVAATPSDDIPLAENAPPSEGASFVAGETMDDLLGELERIVADETEPIRAAPAAGDYDGYRLGIVFSTREDLVRKANVALRLLRG